MSIRITRRGIPINDNAARPGSRGGEGIDQHAYNNMTAPAAQFRCTPMPGQGAASGQRAVQLRLFTPDGAVIESHMSSARSGNGASAKGVTEEGPAASQQVNPTDIGGDDVSGGAI